MEYFTLNNGYAVPVLGLGTGHADNIDPEEVKECYMSAVDLGYRHFDTAKMYPSQGLLGDALAAKIQDGSVSRKDLFITSKILNYADDPDSVPNVVAKCLSDLKTSYIDLYLMHWPVCTKSATDFSCDDSVDYLDTYKALENAVDKGLIRSIGVSNFSCQQLQRLLDSCRIKPAVNQIEVHPYHRQQELVDFCQQKGIHVTAYAPFAISAVYSKHVGAFSEDRGKSPMEDSDVISIAKKYNKTPAQVLLRYAIERGISVIPKSLNSRRMTENMQVFDFKLSSSDQELLYSLDKKSRIITACIWRSSKYHPFADEL